MKSSYTYNNNIPADKLVLGGASVVGVLNAMTLVLVPADVNSVKISQYTQSCCEYISGYT